MVIHLNNNTFLAGSDVPMLNLFSVTRFPEGFLGQSEAALCLVNVRLDYLAVNMHEKA